MTKFIITYFDGDGYPSAWFNSEEELNRFVTKEGISKMDISDILEVEVKRVIRSPLDMHKEHDRLIEEYAKKTKINGG